MRLALFQPDIPQNTGTILRTAACFSVPVDIIEPAGFDLSGRALRRSGLDYLAAVEMMRHASWRAFIETRRQQRGRLVLLTTKATTPYIAHRFEADDILLLGRESAGAPAYVHDAADVSLTIPLKPSLRSLNVAVAAAMVLGEALRQIGAFDNLRPES